MILGSTSRPDPGALSLVVADAFAFESEAFVRSGPDLVSIVARNPWPDPGSLVEVSLLDREAPEEAARRLEAGVLPPEGLMVSGMEVYFLREGKGIDTVHKEAATVRALGQPTTRRGMRTILDLHRRFFGD